MAGFKRTGVGDKLRILTGQPMSISVSYKKSSKLLVKISRPHPLPQKPIVFRVFEIQTHMAQLRWIVSRNKKDHKIPRRFSNDLGREIKHSSSKL